MCLIKVPSRLSDARFARLRHANEMPAGAAVPKLDRPDHDIALARFYPDHTGGCSGDGQDACFSRGSDDMGWIEVASRADDPERVLVEV